MVIFHSYVSLPEGNPAFFMLPGHPVTYMNGQVLPVMAAWSSEPLVISWGSSFNNMSIIIWLFNVAMENHHF